MDICQLKNSSTVSVYRLQASSRESSPPRTAATTSALRRITQRFVDVGGRSAIVRGLPSGPITYLTLGRKASAMALTLQHEHSLFEDENKPGVLRFVESKSRSCAINVLNIIAFVAKILPAAPISYLIGTDCKALLTIYRRRRADRATARNTLHLLQSLPNWAFKSRREGGRERQT
jgi:hypothetical protein